MRLPKVRSVYGTQYTTCQGIREARYFFTSWSTCRVDLWRLWLACNRSDWSLVLWPCMNVVWRSWNLRSMKLKKESFIWNIFKYSQSLSLWIRQPNILAPNLIYSRHHCYSCPSSPSPSCQQKCWKMKTRRQNG